MELHTVELCFPPERVFSLGAIISSVTKGIHRIDTIYGSGAESAIQPNAGVATTRSVGCITIEQLCKNEIK